MTTREEVKRLFHIWQFSQGERCGCATHEVENLQVCKRELAWRAYCEARDEYIGDPRHGVRRPDLRDILDLFDSVN